MFASIVSKLLRRPISMLSIIDVIVFFADLLRPDNTNLKMFEDGSMGSLVKDLSEIAVATPEDALALLARGNDFRHVSATAMNAKSSRSHTLFRMAVETRGGGGMEAVCEDDGMSVSSNVGDAAMESKSDDGSSVGTTRRPSISRVNCITVTIRLYPCVFPLYRIVPILHVPVFLLYQSLSL